MLLTSTEISAWGTLPNGPQRQQRWAHILPNIIENMRHGLYSQIATWITTEEQRALLSPPYQQGFLTQVYAQDLLVWMYTTPDPFATAVLFAQHADWTPHTPHTSKSGRGVKQTAALLVLELAKEHADAPHRFNTDTILFDFCRGLSFTPKLPNPNNILGRSLPTFCAYALGQQTTGHDAAIIGASAVAALVADTAQWNIHNAPLLALAWKRGLTVGGMVADHAVLRQRRIAHCGQHAKLAFLRAVGDPYTDTPQPTAINCLFS